MCVYMRIYIYATFPMCACVYINAYMCVCVCVHRLHQMHNDACLVGVPRCMLDASSRIAFSSTARYSLQSIPQMSSKV